MIFDHNGPLSVLMPTSTKTRAAPIPAFNLTRQYESIKDEIHAAIDRVLTTQHFIGGSELEQFEQEAARYLGVSAVVGCASGTDALWLGLQAMRVGPGDAVLTTPFSFFASASSIARCGAAPVFTDIDPGTLNLSPDAAPVALKDRQRAVKAIIPVHLYGQCADMHSFEKLSGEFGVTVLEDAAQAFGAKWCGRSAGTLGRAAAFSFYPTKNLAAYGEGGCVSTNDLELAAHLRKLRNHGSQQRYYHGEIGWNSRLDAIQAAVLRVKLRHLEQWNNQRRTLAQRYDALLQQAGLVERGSTRPREEAPLAILEVRPEAFHIFHQYVVRALRRDELRASLAERGIGSEVYYPLPLHLQQAFAYLGYKRGDFPEAERAAREVVALPMFPELREGEQQKVVAAIAEFYSQADRSFTSSLRP
jgi:dTDP-4-amino-4,6-dideoxygalactose transaminase